MLKRLSAYQIPEITQYLQVVKLVHSKTLKVKYTYALTYTQIGMWVCINIHYAPDNSIFKFLIKIQGQGGLYTSVIW